MKRTASLVLAGLTVFMLAACAPVVLSPATGTPPATLTPQPATPTIVWFPPSETPTAQPIVTQGPTPERKPGVGSLLLSDRFSSRGVWNPGTSEDAGIDVSRGQLTIAVQPGVSAFRIRQGPMLTAFYAEITAKPSLCRAGDEYGLLFRAPNNAAFYSFVLSCDGTARVERVRIGRSYPPLHPAMRSADAPLGAPGEVRLGVWASGPDLRFFLNDHYQFGVTDTTYKSGAVGVFAHAAGSTPVTVTFSDLSIYNVSYSPPATPTP